MITENRALLCEFIAGTEEAVATFRGDIFVTDYLDLLFNNRIHY